MNFEINIFGKFLGMKYGRFEQLPVWQTAVRLGTVVYALTRDRFFAQPGDLCSQLRRAALSVANNIAEGYERGTTAELLTFLYIARGSAGEVRSMLRFIEEFPDAAHLNKERSQALALAESCSRHIQKWAESMQNSDIKGQRHLTDATREEYRRERKREVFWQMLTEKNEIARQEREAQEKERRRQGASRQSE